MDLKELKVKLYETCLEHINQRITVAKQAMNTAQSAANEEGKSSAGDKYETGRAMMQIERDKNAAQLAEALKIKKILEQFPPAKTLEKAEAGALLQTDSGLFYLCVSAGKISAEGQNAFAVSPVTPFGQACSGKKANECFSVNGKAFKILEIA
ncbi:hypothetical protein FUAX_12190 [Fulvitalea axinellae]|uniref:3-oxoacyl-ACP synthase n=1 Tax=Fulvitalea axinellae TaxID=1182444 RepID=A0AAU9CLH6_9BACT|nr:hypothetical protein FUAX_12190 [Fulvitalea axinellae]